MATRMQQRRGTASQWTSANPILNAAEMGWESDTNKFKMGDGVNHWADLDYFVDSNSTVNPAFGTSITFEGATADSFETTLAVTDPTADRTITFPDATGTVALTSALSSYAPLNSPTFTGTVTLPDNTISQSMMADDSVGTNEIGGLAVTEGKIADGAVTSVKIANDTIVNADINSAAAIEQSKISGLTTDLAAKLALAGGTMTGAIAMGTNKITGLGTPTDSTDAATKAYVDAVTEGLHIHEAAIAATTANVVLSSALENGDTLDGITLATGNRILVKNQTTQSENGIYVVQASGQPTRATDFDTASEVDSGDFIFVYSGTVNGGTGWVQTNRPATIGTDAIAFTQFSGAGTYTAGTGLTLTGTTFSVNEPVASQSGNSGKYLTTDGTNTSWGTVSGYSAPTLGSTSIASGATVTTISGLTDVVLNGAGSVQDELTLLLMGAL